MSESQHQSPLGVAISLVGVSRIAQALQVSRRAVSKWEKARRMPRTEWTGETSYSQTIQELTANQVTRDQLLAKWPEPQAQTA